jgi:hypothetical protein
MPLQIIDDLYNEVRRLNIAGIKVAGDDFRLKNLLEEIGKIKGSSPVMQKLHSAGTRLVESQEKGLADNFFEFSNLVMAVKATQVDTEISGELKVIETTPLIGPNEISYRRIYPLIEALTSSGPGRSQVVAEYIESGLPVDFRLVDPLIKSLSGYIEIAEYSKELLKKANSNILPVLENSFKIKGNRGDGRKLELIYHFARDRKKELYLEALTGGSAEVRESAIKILLNYSDGEKSIKEFAKQQDKELKEYIEKLVNLFKKVKEERDPNECASENIIISAIRKMGLKK